MWVVVIAKFGSLKAFQSKVAGILVSGFIFCVQEYPMVETFFYFHMLLFNHNWG